MDQSQWIVVGVGIGALALGIIFIVMGVLSRRKLTMMKETPTINAAQAAQAASSEGINRVEVFGVADSPTPLSAPGTGTSCVYYRHKVERMTERRITDEHGYTRTEQDWDTVVDSKINTPFVVRDDSGEIRVVPDGAEFVAQITMNDQVGSFGYDEPEAGGGVLGRVMDTVMDAALNQGPGYYRTSEWVIPTGQPVYVMGNAFTTPAGPVIQEGDGPLIISYKSEEGLTRKYTWHFALWTVFGVLFGAGGIAAVVYGAKFMKK